MSVSLQSLIHEPKLHARPALATELIAFLLIGGAAALGFVGISTLLIGLGTGVPDWIVSSGSYALFIVPVYLLHRRYSFRSDVPHRVGLPRYAAVQLSALMLASLFSYLCYHVLGLHTVLAAAMVIGLTSGVNFAVLKLWAFASGR
jgi:putative flippase GtrA